MAFQLTYDPSLDADAVAEAEERDAENLATGELIEEASSGKFAGKFDSQEALEKGYLELERKLSSRNNQEPTEEEGEEEPTDDEDAVEEEEVTDEEFDADPTVVAVRAASEEFYANGGQISQETYEALSEIPSQQLLDTYLALQSLQGEQPQAAEAEEYDAPDLNQSEVDQVQGEVGGKEAYSALLNWAADNLPEEQLEAYNEIVDTGSLHAIKLSLRAIAADYQAANGYEGQMVTGKPAKSTTGFRSQAELVAAQRDPRYDNDPAYRQDVFEKLERSNIQF